jgi:alkylation response protein AidB-like acyl-CoA dehydrogenase
VSELPDDLDIQRRLATVRVAVMEATEHVRSPRHSTRYRTTRNLIIAGAAIAALTAGTVIAVQATQDYIDQTVQCFEHASLDSRWAGVQGSGENNGPLDPIDACTLIWHESHFSPDGADEAGQGTGTVPDLVACTLSTGAPAGFPREDGPPDDTDFCAALGLADWDSD